MRGARFEADAPLRDRESRCIKGIGIQSSTGSLAESFSNFGSFWAADLTKCLAGNAQIVVLEGFSLASGEILGSDLTKCPKIDGFC